MQVYTSDVDKQKTDAAKHTCSDTLSDRMCKGVLRTSQGCGTKSKSKHRIVLLKETPHSKKLLATIQGRRLSQSPRNESCERLQASHRCTQWRLYDLKNVKLKTLRSEMLVESFKCAARTDVWVRNSNGGVLKGVPDSRHRNKNVQKVVVLSTSASSTGRIHRASGHLRQLHGQPARGAPATTPATCPHALTGLHRWSSWLPLKTHARPQDTSSSHYAFASSSHNAFACRPACKGYTSASARWRSVTLRGGG